MATCRISRLEPAWDDDRDFGDADWFAVDHQERPGTDFYSDADDDCDVD